MKRLDLLRYSLLRAACEMGNGRVRYLPDQRPASTPGMVFIFITRCGVSFIPLRLPLKAPHQLSSRSGAGVGWLSGRKCSKRSQSRITSRASVTPDQAAA